jgi:hypothetical protein
MITNTRRDPDFGFDFKLNFEYFFFFFRSGFGYILRRMIMSVNRSVEEQYY